MKSRIFKNRHIRMDESVSANLAGGFTLIETLVAMMLLAICLVVILQLFSGGLKSAKMAEDYTRAVFFAREKMEETLLAETFQEAVTEGTFDDIYSWKVDIALVETDDETQDYPVDLYQVDVFVFWTVGDKEKKIQLNCLTIDEKKDLDG